MRPARLIRVMPPSNDSTRNSMWAPSGVNHSRGAVAGVRCDFGVYSARRSSRTGEAGALHRGDGVDQKTIQESGRWAERRKNPGTVTFPLVLSNGDCVL